MLPSVAKLVEQVCVCAEGIHFEGDLDSEVLRIKCLSFTTEFQKRFVLPRKYFPWVDAEFVNVTNVVLIWDLSG